MHKRLTAAPLLTDMAACQSFSDAHSETGASSLTDFAKPRARPRAAPPPGPERLRTSSLGCSVANGALANIVRRDRAGCIRSITPSSRGSIASSPASTNRSTTAVRTPIGPRRRCSPTLGQPSSSPPTASGDILHRNCTSSDKCAPPTVRIAHLHGPSVPRRGPGCARPTIATAAERTRAATLDSDRGENTVGAVMIG